MLGSPVEGRRADRRGLQVENGMYTFNVFIILSYAAKHVCSSHTNCAIITKGAAKEILNTQKGGGESDEHLPHVHRIWGIWVSPHLIHTEEIIMT